MTAPHPGGANGPGEGRRGRSRSRPGHEDPVRAARRARRRRRGLGLIAFGVAGLVLIGSASLLVLASLSAVDDAATGFERQRAELVGLLGPAADSLDRAADSAANAGSSLAETRDAAGSAANLTTRLAESFEGLAALGAFEVLGLRPFSNLSGQFTSVATEARQLSTDLTEASAAMDRNITDSIAVAADLRALADQLDALEASLGGPPAGTGATPAPGASGVTGNPDVAPTSGSLPVAAARFVLMGLLLWLAIPAIVSVWVGWRWSRAAPEA